jgi:hypothetical protein
VIRDDQDHRGRQDKLDRVIQAEIKSWGPAPEARPPAHVHRVPSGWQQARIGPRRAHSGFRCPGGHHRKAGRARSLFVQESGVLGAGVAQPAIESGTQDDPNVRGNRGASGICGDIARKTDIGSRSFDQDGSLTESRMRREKMLAAGRPLARTRGSRRRFLRPEHRGKGKSQQGGNGRPCEVRMIC